MKKFILVFILLLLTVPILAQVTAPAPEANFWHQLIPYGVSVLAITVVYLSQKWLGFSPDKFQVERIINTIINLITNVEQQNKKMPGLEKQRIVRNQILQGFPDGGKMPLKKKDMNWIERNLGGVDNAIEKAFQVSHLAGIGKGLLKALR